MQLTLDGEGALYLQIYRALQRLILDGTLEAGERLPASRTMATDLGVSRNVVVLAYEQLQAEGYISAQVGSGTRVCETKPHRELESASRQRVEWHRMSHQPLLTDAAQIACRHWRSRKSDKSEARLKWDFRYGAVELDQHAIRVLARLNGRLFYQASIQYTDPQGDGRLRKQISGYLNRSRGCRSHPDQICIVNGSQQGLDLLARLLIKPGLPLYLEEPGYQGARLVFDTAGAELRPVPVDEQGIVTAGLPNSGATSGVVYVTPSHQFPTGSIMSLSRRLALLEWAERHASYIIEDDYDGEFRFQGRPIAALQGIDEGVRTLYVGTFSKVLYPSLRIGYVVLPEALVEPFVALRWQSDRQTNTHQQLVLAEFIRCGEYERHIRRMAKRYATKRKCLLQALERHFGDQIVLQGSNAGLHILVWFKDQSLHSQEQVLLTRARAQGLGIYPVSPLYTGTAPQRLGLLFGYSGIAEQMIEPGIDQLARLVAWASGEPGESDTE